MPHDVYISHTTKDKVLADAACAELESHGVRCWIAPRDIAAGISWAEAIQSAIAESRIVVLILSTAAMESDVVTREITFTSSLSKPTVTLRIADVALSASLARVMRAQYHIDAFTPPLVRRLEAFASTVTALLKNPATPTISSTVVCGAGTVSPLQTASGNTVNPQIQSSTKKETNAAKAHDVFISYDFDDSSLAFAICEAHETSGTKCWIAQRDIPHGANWADIIPDAIDICQIMVLLSTKASMASDQVKRELGLAADDSKEIISVRFEDVLPEKAFKFYLKGKNWLDAFSSPTEEYMPRIVTAVKALLGPSDIVITGSPAAPSPTTPTTRTPHSNESSTQNLQTQVLIEHERNLQTKPAVVVAPPKRKALIVQPVVEITGHTAGVNSASFSPDGNRIVTGSSDKTLRIWDAHSGRQIAVLEGHKSTVFAATYSPDGKKLLSASDDKSACIWDARDLNVTMTRSGHESWVTSAAFSSDGVRIVTGGGDTTARIWDTESGRQIGVLRGHGSTVSSAMFSRSGAFIVTASADKEARLWESTSGRLISTFKGHTDWVVSATLSKDERRLLTESHDNTARIWDAQSGRQLFVLSGHGAWVNYAAFSPDGRHLVTAGNDNTARIRESNSGKQLVVMKGHHDWVFCARFSPGGSRMVTSSSDKTVRVWRTGYKEIT